MPSAIRRRASEYRTSFPLEELELTLEDGAELRLAFKRLDWDALSDEARLAKPEFLHDPLREPAVYAELLAPRPLGAPRCYGSRADPDAGPPLALHRVGRGPRALPGRRAEALGGGGALAWHDAPTLGRGARPARGGRPPARLRLARTTAAGSIARARFRCGAGRSRPARPALGRAAAARYEAASRGAARALPRTVIHGEFYASNVLVAGGPAEPRVAPVDWELAASAPGSSTSRRLSAAAGATRIARRSPPPTAPPPGRLASLARSSTSPACTWRCSGSAGRSRAGAHRRSSGTTGSARRSRWPRGWSFERGSAA